MAPTLDSVTQPTSRLSTNIVALRQYLKKCFLFSYDICIDFEYFKSCWTLTGHMVIAVMVSEIGQNSYICNMIQIVFDSIKMKEGTNEIYASQGFLSL